MKLSLLALSSVLLFSDVEIISQLPAYSERTEQVAIDSGKWEVEVFTDGNVADLSCTYTHLGEVLSKQEHTRHCMVKTEEVLPAYISVKVTNNESSMITYKVRAFSIVPIK